MSLRMKRTISRSSFGFGKKEKKEENGLLTPQGGGKFTSGTLEEVVEHLCGCMGSLRGRSEAGMFLSAFFAMVEPFDFFECMRARLLALQDEGEGKKAKEQLEGLCQLLYDYLSKYWDRDIVNDPFYTKHVFSSFSPFPLSPFPFPNLSYPGG